MSRKGKEVQAVTNAAREAAKTLATWGTVEVMAQKVMVETERAASAQNFAEFLLSGAGSRALVKIGDSVFRIEG
jgi:hypothetical protein